MQFANDHLRVWNKEQTLVPLHYNAAQLDFLANRTGRDIVLKARQIGMSTVIQAELFRTAVTRRAVTATLGNDMENTRKLRRMALAFYDALPEELRPPRKVNNESITTYTQSKSNSVIATAGNRNAGRGGTYSDIHGSEVAFWKDAEAILAGILQGGNPRIALESTPNGAQGWFYDMCMEALDRTSDWTLHFYEWWWDKDYRDPLPDGETLRYSPEEQDLVERHGLVAEQIQWRRRKQRELRRMFLQEYPEDVRSCFLLSGIGFFGALTDVFTAPSNVAPIEGHRYVAGIDWGQMNDYTVLSIGDVTAKTQVSLLRLRGMSWGDIRRRVADECRRWNAVTIVPEENAAQANIEELRKLIDGIRPFTTTSSSKARAIGGLYEALYEDGWTLLSDANQQREMRALQAKQTPTGVWSYSAPSGEHDDIVIANMLMIHAATQPDRVPFTW